MKDVAATKKVSKKGANEYTPAQIERALRTFAIGIDDVMQRLHKKGTNVALTSFVVSVTDKGDIFWAFDYNGGLNEDAALVLLATVLREVLSHHRME